jgi:hypothetical protein
MPLNPESTKEQKDALSKALFQHANRMGSIGVLPAVSTPEGLVRVGYATQDGQVTEEGQMALSLKKVGALNDDYTLNNTGKALMASRDDLLKEENIDLYIESKKLNLDEQEDIGLWDGIKQLASDVGKGAKTIGELALLDASSGGTFTPEQQAERRIKAEEIVKDMAISTTTIGKGLVTAEDKLWAKAFNEGVMQDYQVAYLDQKFDRDMADMEKVNTSEVADELAKVIGVKTQFAEGRKQAEVTLGDEETQRAIEEGRKAGLALSIVNPLAPESVAAGVGFGVARKGLAQAFKPISRKLLESEAKAARALEASQRVTGLNSHLAQTNYLAQKAEQEALFAERQADKYSRLGLPERANATRKLADNLRAKGLDAGARVQGLTDEIARASDEAAKLAQDAAVADKIKFVSQRARELPGLPIQAIGGLVEGTGMAMIGIDKGLSALASKIGADKAWNAMNRISSLSGLGGAGAAMGLGPAAFVPAAIRTAWSTAPFLKGAGHFVRMIGKETANARSQIPFWQRVANYETLGAVPRSIAHLMDTSTLGSRITGFAGDVTKGMAAAYPVDLAFQWISEGGEMDMNTLKQAAAETVVFGGTGAALGGITAGSQERIKKLQRGDAINFYRTLKDGSQRVAFNALNDGMKRSIGTYSASFPNLNIRFTDQGGGAFDPASNTAFINPMARNPLKPLLAHEINHYILVRNQMEGGIAAALVGDGVQTGGLLRGKDGKLDENFQAFKDEYTRRLEAQHNRQINTRIAAGEKVPARERAFAAPTDNDIAIEYFVDSMADDMMGMAETGELGKQAGRMLVTRKMQAFGNAILQQAPIIKDFFYKLGGATDKNGRAVYGNGLLAEGIREIPEMKKLFRKMISESAGRPMHVAKVTKGESEGHMIPISGKDDPILNEMPSMFESDENGVPLRDRNGELIPLSDETEKLRATSGLLLVEDQQNRLNRGETLEPGELRFNPEEDSWTGEYLTDRQIQILRASGRFNNAQLRQLDLLNGAAKENTGRRFLVFNQPATKKRKGKRVAYDTLGVSMREIVPYGIKITKDGNLLVRLMSVQQLHANAFEKAASKRGQTLYKGNAEQILNDVNQVIENHGRNEPTDAYFKKEYGNEWEVRKNFINTVFGNVGKGQKDINPLLAAEKAKNAVVKTYRIDRINKATELEGRTNLPYQNHLVKVNYLPEGEPILDENGEPKDLRYTPSYEESQVRMPEAQRAMPDGEQGSDVTLTRLREIRDGLDENLTEREAIDELDFIINDAPSGYFPQDILDKVDQAKRDIEEEFTTWAGRGDSGASTESAISSVMSFLDSKESRGEAAPTRFMPEKLDSDYMKAVESGDVEAQQRMVDEAAKQAGYSVRAFHRTNSDKFSVFDLSKTGSASGGNIKFRKPAVFFTVDGPKIRKLTKMLEDKGFKQGYGSREINAYLAIDPEVDYIPNNAEDGTEVAITNATRIKSADPITRDDSGNVIPLSKRFDVGSRDMRFMPEPLPANYQSSRDTTFLYQSIGPDGIVNLNRPIKSTEALPTISTRHEYPVEDFTVSKFDKRASILYAKNKNGEDVSFKFDPQLMKQPEFADFDDLYDGAVVQLAMADRHGATDGDMGGHSFPDLKVNQDIIVDDGNGNEYKLVWSNNAWGPVKNMSTKAQKYGATTLLTYNMDQHAHDSNTRTVRIFSNEIANSNLSAKDQSTLLIVMNVALKKAQSSANKQDLRALLKTKKDLIDLLKKDDKAISQAKGYVGKKPLSPEERLALENEIEGNQKDIDDENKFLEEALGTKLAGNEEVKVDALFRNYQNKRRAYEKTPTSETKKKAMVEAEKELKAYQKTKEFKKAEGLLPSRELDKFSNTFKGRKSLILAVKNKEASVKWHGFDSQKISQAIGDQLTGDSLHIVSSVELSSDPNFKAVYLGDDPREIARMSPSEQKAALQLKANPNFVAHEAYLWSMLGPAESKHIYNTNQRSVLESFPNFLNEYSKLPVKPGKLKLNDPNSKASEFNIVNTIRDQSKIGIVFRAEKGKNKETKSQRNGRQ